MANTEDDILQFPNAEDLQIGTQNLESMDEWAKSKNECGGLCAVITAIMEQIRPVRTEQRRRKRSVRDGK